MKMYYALALKTRGSVRALIRSVEETNGPEAWRLIHSRYAPDTQNRQYAVMQKIMMPANAWCDYTEGFESALRSWELDVGELERASGSALANAVKYTVMMSVVGELSCISSVDPWIMRVTLNSVSSTRRQAGADYLLLDSGVQLHACPIAYPGQKIPLPDP